MDVDAILESIGNGAPLLSRAEALEQPSPVPAEPGVYAWFFSRVSGLFPIAGSATRDSFELLYLGIAPSRPGSKSSLRRRLRGHLRGNASGSTLRLTLGCMLATELGIELRQTGASGRMTFGAGEAALSEWLDENARIAWVVLPEPWLVEKELIQRLSLPLNLEFNSAHPFHTRLSELRRNARRHARALPPIR